MTLQIYAVINTLNRKVYVGQTKKSLDERWARHKQLARNGVQRPLYSAIRKYGEEVFAVCTLERIETPTELDNRERYWIAEFEATNREKGYNITDGGGGGDVFSQHPNKENIRAKYKARRWTEDQRHKFRSTVKGREHGPMDPQRKERIRRTMLERGIRPVVFPRFSGEQHPMWGKKHTEEARKKISEAGKGRKASEKLRAVSRERWSDPKNNPVYVEVPQELLEDLIRRGLSMKDIALHFSIRRQTIHEKIKKYWGKTLNQLKVEWGLPLLVRKPKSKAGNDLLRANAPIQEDSPCPVLPSKLSA